MKPLYEYIEDHADLVVLTGENRDEPAFRVEIDATRPDGANWCLRRGCPDEAQALRAVNEFLAPFGKTFKALDELPPFKAETVNEAPAEPDEKDEEPEEDDPKPTRLKFTPKPRGAKKT